MIGSIELQVISFILTSHDQEAVDTLLDYDSSYYALFPKQIQFIQNHVQDTGKVPDRATFQFQFPDFNVISVAEPLEWLKKGLNENKQHILLLETFNKLTDLGEGDTADAWAYLNSQCDKAQELDASAPMDIVHDVDKRKQQVIDFNKQNRIPTGFDEIDKVMYGGLSTVEELLIILARMGTGKSWCCTRFMETAQKHGFNVAYYSPEMQASLLATRFDTWREHFANSQLFRGQYSPEYEEYTEKLKSLPANAFIIEDKDVPSNSVSVSFLKKFVKKNNIKELIIDGIAYMTDDRAKPHDTDYIKYKNIGEDLFRLSKECGCAVILVMQANRATKDSKDEKGQPFPDIYNIEGSDHPARIATQIFAIRQLFDQHILDMRLEKSRNAQNQKPVFSYKWDINVGQLEYIPTTTDAPAITTPLVETGFDTPDISNITAMSTTDDIIDDLDEEVQF